MENQSNYGGQPGRPPQVFDPHTEAAVVAAIARSSVSPQLHGKAHQDLAAPIVIFPERAETKNLENLLERPLACRGTVEVNDHSSFIRYVDRHLTIGTVLFCRVDEHGGQFEAVFDDHEPVVDKAKAGAPGWGAHRCLYTAEHTPEWRRWREFDGKPMPQVKLARFIEDNLFDIAEPDGASMLEIVKSLEASLGGSFRSAIRLDNGDRKLEYVRTTNAMAGVKGDLQIPGEFTLKLPVFTDGPAYTVTARFRYDIDGGALALRYEIVRPHKVIELALTEARQAIETALKVQVLRGTPIPQGNGRLEPQLHVL